jgi:hypothetical protein
MKLSQVLTVNAILFIAAGIGFTVYAPNVLAFFGVPELPGDSKELYWNIVSFARMFGAVLLACGLLLWGLRGAGQSNLEHHQAQRDLLFSLVFGFIIMTITALTQQSSVWGSLAGWIVTAVFAIFAAVYIYFLAKKGS